MIKVIHICDKFGMKGSTTHGVSRLFAWWMPRYDTDRYDVSLYALKTPDAASRALEAEGVRMTYLGKPKLRPDILTSFLALIRSERPDLLHLHGWIAANFGRLAGFVTGVPTIVHEHGVDPRFPLSQRLADRLLSKATHTAVAVSQSVYKFMIAHRSMPASKVRVIYNGAPLDEFRPAEPASAAAEKERLGIPAGSPVIGTVGRLDTQKGITHLLNAAVDVLRAVPEARFLIVGDGPGMDELKAEADALGIRDRVLFAGHRTDVPVLQTMMDIQAFPSLWEGTPLTVFEAMAMGRTIVSTDVDGLGEVLRDGRSALIVPPAQPKPLADAIIRLLADRDLAARLAFGARESSADYDIGRTVRNLEELYEEMAGSGRQQA